MIKTNIKMRVTPEQLIEIGKIKPICKSFTNAKFIFIYKDGRITWSNKEYKFDRKKTMQEIDPELFIRTNGSCIEKEEFIYPMWLKSKKKNIIVRFDSFNKGEVVYVSKEESFYKTGMTLGFIPHTDTTIWEQVENPNLATDKEIEQVINEEYEKKDSSINNGGKTDYYQLKNAPFPINDFDDFAEWRGLNGNQFNMGKAMWTFNIGRHSGTNYERDLNKIIHYANRELLRLKRDGK